MEKRKCEKCGKEFLPFNDKMKLCKKCHQKKDSEGGDKMFRNDSYGQARQGGQSHHRNHDSTSSEFEPLKPEYKLDNFYTGTDCIIPKVYRETSQGIANQFNDVDIKRSQIRRFFEMVRTIHEQYQNSEKNDKDRDLAIQNINKLLPQAQYSQERKVTKRCFTDFMNHYIDMTTQDIKNLKGFKELFTSVICYMRKE